MKAISAVLSIFVGLPIWFYLFYQILVRVNASELMFFLFWCYVPVLILIAVIAEALKGTKNG